MADVVIHTTGSTLDQAEIQNAASEETLVALLDQVIILVKNLTKNQKTDKDQNDKNQKNFNDKLDKHFGKQSVADKFKSIFSGSHEEGTATTTGGAAIPALMGGLTGLGSEITALIPEIELAAAAFAVFEVVTTVLSDLAHVAGSLVNTFLSGETHLSAYTDAVAKSLANIPLIGSFIDLISSGIKVLENWNNTIYRLNAVGASFNNNLADMRLAAAKTWMSLDKFSDVVIHNAGIFAQMGSVMDGVNHYTNIANISMNKFRQQINGMGISLEQYNEELPGLLALIGPSAVARGDSDEKLARSALQLSSEFDAMAKLTGKQRQDQAAELQALQADAAYKLKLASMTDEQRDAANRALAQVSATMGSTAAELLKMKILGIVPLRKDMQTLLYATPGVANSLENLHKSIEGGSLSAKELDNQTANMLDSAIRSGKSYQTILNAAASGIGGSAGDIADVFNQLLANAQRSIKQDGSFDREEFLQRMEKIRNDQQASSEEKATLEQIQADLSRYQEQFYELVLIPLLHEMAPEVNELVKWFKQNPIDMKQIDLAVHEGIDILLNVIKWLGAHSKTIGFILESALLALVPLALVVSAIGVALVALGGLITALVLGIKDAVQAVSDLIPDIVKNPKQTGEAAIDVAKSLFFGAGNIKGKKGFATGTIGNGGLLQDFGKGTPTVLHGLESVLTAEQLTNLVNGTQNQQQINDTGIIEALKNIGTKLDQMTKNSDMYIPIYNKLDDLADLFSRNVRSNREIAKAVK